QRRHAVQPMQAAVTRYRQLMGLALGYMPEGDPDFALQALAGEPEPITLADGSALTFDSGSYATIMPSASRPTKLWPEAYWQAALRRLVDAGCAPLVFAGNDE